MIRSILFFGHYPNPADKNLNIFYQNLIYQLADMGVNCTVVSPVSITKYRRDIAIIPKIAIERTSQGAEVCVFFPRYLSYSSKKILGIDTHVWTVKAYRKAAIRVARKQRLRADATYGHFINIGGIPACKMGMELCVPSFVANGESDLNPLTYNYHSRYDLIAFKNCSGIISVSGKNREELISLHLIEPKKIKIIPNAINPRMFWQRNKIDARKKYGFPQAACIAGFVGSLTERKGPLRVLKAAESIPELYLAFAGVGPQVPMGKQVIFCQPIVHDDLPVFLSACDFFVLPTLNEGCCNAIIEAMACGLPVISSDLPFNDEILNNDNSIRVNPLSTSELTAAMRTLAEDEEKRMSLSKNALITAQTMDIQSRAIKILEFMNSKS